MNSPLPFPKTSIWNYLLTLLAIIIFIPVLIILIPIVLFNDLIFGKYNGWNYNYRCFGNAFKFLNFFLGIRNIQMYPYQHSSKNKYVFVANHISYFDIPEMLIGIKQPVRILGKKGPDKIPIFGYYYRKSTVMVDRTSNESRAKSINLLKHYLEKGISILVCPEGTFNMTNKPLLPFYDGAFKLAIETQTNIKPLLILDTFNTLHYSGAAIRNGISRMVYLEEINVQGLTTNDLEAVKQKTITVMENAIKDYKAPWLKE